MKRNCRKIFIHDKEVVAVALSFGSHKVGLIILLQELHYIHFWYISRMNTDN